MRTPSLKHTLLGAAFALAVTGAAFGRGPSHPSAPAVSRRAPAAVAPFALARVLSSAPPEVVVVTLDAPAHPMPGARSAASFGRDDEAFIAHAPAAGTLILAARDAVRAERVARRIMATGRTVLVLEGGTDAWDRAMSADPPAPAANADAATRARYAFDVALRHALGDPAMSPAAPVHAAPPPAANGAPAAHREGC